MAKFLKLLQLQRTTGLDVSGFWGVLISVRTQDIKLQNYVCVSAEKVSAASNRIYKILFFFLIDVIVFMAFITDR